MRRFLTIIFLIGALGAVYVMSQNPSHEKDWWPYYEKTPDAEIRDNTILLKNVRNWNHNTTEILSEEWLDEVSVNMNSIEKVWFGYSGFSKIPVLGHTFLSFELSDGSAYTLSVEARREKDEEYSAFKGLFNQYELQYGWGTERDFVGVRVFMLNQPVELYELNVSKEEARAIFVTMAEKTHTIAEKPQFYNTLTSNCTNELAKAIGSKYPGRISYDLSHNLPGLSISYLQREELLTASNRKTIPKYNEELQNTIDTTPKDFSQTLRSILQDEYN